ncbi:MAG: WYL domain-containing protein [Gammaproteobacteria bacterium]|nr:WYL domain-containing protein [Gammaproteobacteria bacterium]MBU1653354.1 WYL domain-containing protein [Gammaproteobacteria bacterium]MBU1962781.1 WYL domain-containing protein [Gammaproteobacteria bacterium]
MNDTLLRHWTMLRYVPQHPRKIASAELQQRLAAAGHEISLRSIQRDLNNLSKSFPLTSDGENPQGWSWAPGSPRLGVPALDPQAALAFKLVEAHLQRLLPQSTLDYLAPWFHTASGVLEAQGTGLAAWPEKIRVLSRGLPQRPPAIDPEIQSIVYEGLLQERRIAISYQPPWAEAAKDYVANPLALVIRDGMLYLVCTLWDYQEPRHLLLHRMLSAELRDEPAHRLEGFDLDTHIAQGEFSYPLHPELLQLEAIFSGHAATNVYESPLSEDQAWEALDDDSLRVSAKVHDTYELRAWLLAFGDEVTVLGPESLVAEFAEIAANLADAYLNE